MRLQKFIANSGVCSRRKAEEIILQGRVEVNGEVVDTLGTKVDDENDVVKVDGKVVSENKQHIYIMLNKPEGCVTTAKDQFERKTVMDYVDIDERVYPVGRLDYDTSGLLLLTNDGELAFESGVSATITGNMLTTVACATIRSDKKMLEGIGRNVTPEYEKTQKITK